MIRRLLDLLKMQRRCALVQSRFPGTVLESGVVIKGDLDRLELGSGVVIQSNCVLHLGGMSWCEGTGRIRIGDNAVISPNCVLYGCGPGGITIGSNFDCGPGVGIFASQTDRRRGPGHHVFAPVAIGDSVIIFTNAVLGPGVSIGDRAVVAAGAVVLADVPADTMVAGIPAMPVRH